MTKTFPNQPMNNGWMPKGTEAWWATASEHQSEMLDFMSHRLSKDADAVRELGQSRSWEDASGVHSKWLQDTFKDYSAEASKLMAINVKQAADAAQDRRAHR
jgi:hypothetical protein